MGSTAACTETATRQDPAGNIPHSRCCAFPHGLTWLNRCFLSLLAAAQLSGTT